MRRAAQLEMSGVEREGREESCRRFLQPENKLRAVKESGSSRVARLLRAWDLSLSMGSVVVHAVTGEL